MSIQAMNWALKLTDDELATGAKFLLVAIANYADEEGVCWPSQSRLGKDTNQTDRTVRTHMSTLETTGYIQRSERYDEGKRLTDLIRLCPTNRKNLPVDSEPEKNVATNRKKMSASHTKFSGEPSSEPSVEPSIPPIPPKGGNVVDSKKRKATAKKGDVWERLDETSKEIFEQSFWLNYKNFHRPNDPKALARKAWATALAKREPDANVILDGLRKFRLFVEDKREREGERFNVEIAVPMAATWLNQDRWTNDYGGVVEQAKANDRSELKGFALFEYDYMAWSRAGRKGEPPKIESYPGAEKGR